MLSKPTIYNMNKSALALVPYNRHHFLPVNRQGKDHSMKLPAAGVRSDRYLLPASELQQTSCTSLLLLIERTDRQLDGHRTIAQTLNARSGALPTRYRPGPARRYAHSWWQFDGGKNRGRCTSVRGRVRSPHFSGGRRCLSCRQPACLQLGSWAMGQTDGRITLFQNAPHPRAGAL